MFCADIIWKIIMMVAQRNDGENWEKLKSLGEDEENVILERGE